MIQSPFNEAIEPWPEPVDGHEMMCKLVKFVKKAVRTNAVNRVALSLFMVSTFAQRALEWSSLLVVRPNGDQRQRKNLVSLLAALCLKPIVIREQSAAEIDAIDLQQEQTFILDDPSEDIILRVFERIHIPGTGRYIRPAVIVTDRDIDPDITSSSIVMNLGKGKSH
jgi:hypothetical protein